MWTYKWTTYVSLYEGIFSVHIYQCGQCEHVGWRLMYLLHIYYVHITQHPVRFWCKSQTVLTWIPYRMRRFDVKLVQFALLLMDPRSSTSQRIMPSYQQTRVSHSMTAPCYLNVFHRLWRLPTLSQQHWFGISWTYLFFPAVVNPWQSEYGLYGGIWLHLCLEQESGTTGFHQNTVIVPLWASYVQQHKYTRLVLLYNIFHHETGMCPYRFRAVIWAANYCS